MEDIAKIFSLLLIILLLVIAVVCSNTKFVFAAEITQAQMLVKTAESPAVYSIVNGKKHLIPSEKTFLSCNYKWNDIKTISKAALNSYPDAKLVKTPDDSTVYYLDLSKKLKKAHPSAKVFLDYGNKWEDIIVISNEDLKNYNDAVLAKEKNTSAVYILNKNIRKLISSPQEFKNAGYDWADVIEVSRLDLESYALSNANISATNMPASQETPATENKKSPILNISFAKDSSQDKIVPTRSVGEFLKILLYSENDNTVINGLDITAFGVMSDSDVSYIYLLDENDPGFRYKTTLHDKKGHIVFSEPLVIGAGESRVLTIKAGINESADASYRTIGFGIKTAKDIMTESVISAQFPINGIEKQMQNLGSVIGKISITPVALVNTTLEINQGAKDQTVAKFKISETTGNEDIMLTEISFLGRGNIKYSDLLNFDLVDDNGKILQTQVWMNKDMTVTFDLAKNPLKIKKKTSRVITLKADIMVKGAKEFNFLFDDGAAKGLSSSMGLLLPGECFNNDAKNVNTIAVKNGSLLAFTDTASPKEVVAGKENSLLAIFQINALNTNMEWEEASLNITYSGAPLENDLIFIDTATKKEFLRVGGDVLSREKTITIVPNKIIKYKSYLKFEVRTDIPEKASSNDTYKIILSNFSFKDSNDYYGVVFDAVSSNTLSVRSSALYVTTNKVDGKYVAGTENVKLGSYTLQANYAEDIYVKSITIKSKEGHGEVSAATGFYNFNINLMKEKNQPIGIPITITFNSARRITAGSYITLDIYADTYPTTAGSIIELAAVDINAYGAASGVKTNVSGLGAASNAIEFNQLGFTASANTDFVQGTVNCGKSVKIGSFKLTASSDSVRVTELTVGTSDISDLIAYQNGYTNLTLAYDKKVLSRIEKPLPEFNIFRPNFTVEKGKDMIVDVYVDIPQCCDCPERTLQVSINSLKGYGVYSNVIPIIDSEIISNSVKVECDCAK